MKSYENVTVLVVDDTEATRYSLARQLKSSGVTVVEAASGRKGIDAAIAEKPNLIILDVRLPDINGFEVCKMLKSNTLTKHIPILHLSASYVNTYDKIYGLETGADGYLTHPVEPGILMATVSSLLRLGQAEREMNKAKEVAEDANAAKTQFLANMSHEIRTPLSAMIGFVELLKQSVLSEEQLSYLQIVERNGQHLALLINELLDLSKIESGKMDVEARDFCLIEMLDELIQGTHVQAKQKGIELEVKPFTDLPPRVNGDITKIRQILINLLGNALKFTKVGTVKLEVDALLDANRQSAVLRFTVSDTGKGMCEKEKQQLFTPFTQGDASYSRRFGGTGLGLAVSHRLAKIMNGELILKSSEIDRGSVFEVQIPVKVVDELVSDMQDASKNTKVDLKNVSVLIVDDTPDNQFLVKKLLKSCGAQVEVVSNGTDALQSTKNNDFDVILMDLQMPIMDGYEATRRIRKNGFRRSIIAFTAHARKEAVEGYRDAGFDEYIARPVKAFDLLNSVKRHANLLGPTQLAH